MHTLLSSVANGEATPDEEMGHISSLAKEFSGHISKMAKGDISSVDPLVGEMGERFLMSEKEAENPNALKKDEADKNVLDDNRKKAEEGGAKAEAELENEKTSEINTAVAGKPAEEFNGTQELNKSFDSKLEELNKSFTERIEALEKGYKDQIETLKAENAILRKTPYEPKGRSVTETLNKSQEERIETDSLTGKEAVEKAKKDNPNLSFRDAWRILNGQN